MSHPAAHIYRHVNNNNNNNNNTHICIVPYGRNLQTTGINTIISQNKELRSDPWSSAKDRQRSMLVGDLLQLVSAHCSHTTCICCNLTHHQSFFSQTLVTVRQNILSVSIVQLQNKLPIIIGISQQYQCFAFKFNAYVVFNVLF